MVAGQGTAEAQVDNGFRCTVRPQSPQAFGDGATYRADWTPATSPAVARYVVRRRTFGTLYWRGRTDVDTRTFTDAPLPKNSSVVDFQIDAVNSSGTVIESAPCTVLSSSKDCVLEATANGFRLRWEQPGSAFGASVIRRQVRSGGPFYWRGKTDDVEFSDTPSPGDDPVSYQVLLREQGVIVGVSTCSIGTTQCAATLTPFSAFRNQLNAFHGVLVGDRYFQPGASNADPAVVTARNMSNRSLTTVLTLKDRQSPRNFATLDGLVYFLAGDSEIGTADQNYALFELDPATGESRRLLDLRIREMYGSDQFLYLTPGSDGPRAFLRFDPRTGELLPLTDGVKGGPNNLEGSSPGFFYFRTLLRSNGVADYTAYVFNERTGEISVFVEDGLDLMFRSVVTIDDVVYYRQTGQGPELWTFDPASGDSTPIADFVPGPGNADQVGVADPTTAIAGQIGFNARIPDVGDGFFSYDPATNRLQFQGEPFRPVVEWNGRFWGNGNDGRTYAIDLCS